MGVCVGEGGGLYRDIAKVIYVQTAANTHEVVLLTPIVHSNLLMSLLFRAENVGFVLLKFLDLLPLFSTLNRQPNKRFKTTHGLPATNDQNRIYTVYKNGALIGEYISAFVSYKKYAYMDITFYSSRFSHQKRL